MVKPVKKAAKTRRKTWFKIVAPKIFYNAELGESSVFDARELLGRKVSVNLMNLLRDPKRQNINVQFEINGIGKDKLTTEVVGFEIVPSAIKRVVRRAKVKIEDSKSYKTKEGNSIIIKTILIARAKIASSIRTSLRNSLDNYYKNYFLKQPYDAFLNELISKRLQKSIARDLSKIYPVVVVEIKKMKYFKQGAKSEEEVKIEKPAVEKPKKEAKPKKEEAPKKEEPKKEEKAKEEKKAEETPEKPKE